MAIRDSTRKRDQTPLVDSVKRVHLALLLLFFAFAYGVQVRLDDRETIRALAVIDRLLLVRSVALEPAENRKPLRGIDTVLGIQGAQEIINSMRLDALMKRLGARSAIEINRRYRLAGKSISTEVRAHLSAGAQLSGPHQSHFGTLECRATVLPGARERRQYVSSMTGWPPVLGKVSGDRIYLLNFDLECGLFDHSALLINVDGDWVIGMPQQWAQAFPSIRKTVMGVTPSKLGFDSEFLKLYPNWIRTYAKHEREYELYSLRSVEAAILMFANRHLGTLASRAQFETTIPSLFSTKERSASLLGVSVGINFFMAMAPIVVFALTYTMWRRVRLIDPKSRDLGDLWFVTDLTDSPGKIFGFFWAFSPLAVIVLTYALYAVVSGVGIVVFGLAVWPTGFSTTHPLAASAEFEPWATVLLLLFVLHLAVGALVSAQLLKIWFMHASMRRFRLFWRRLRVTGAKD